MNTFKALVVLLLLFCSFAGLSSCENLSKRAHDPTSTALPHFSKVSHSFDLATSNGIRVVGEELFVRSTDAHGENFSIRYRFRHFGQVDVFNRVCMVSIGEKQFRAPFEFVGSGVFSKLIERLDWINVTDEPIKHYSYFDYQRNLWIQDIWGDPDTGYAQRTMIERLDPQYEESFEIVFPSELLVDLRGSEVISILFQSTKDSLQMTYRGGVRSRMSKLMTDEM